MLRPTLFLLLLLGLAPKGNVQPRPAKVDRPTQADGEGPSYTADGQLKMPERYREWVFLTSGLDMSYSPGGATASHSMFDNVFVNPAAWRAFQQTGTWPDKTTLVLEVREAQGASSINRRGHTQSPEIRGMEVHVKDARLKGGWAFYEFNGAVSAKPIDRPASCYQCHESHAAVDTTFVQFYPTLLGLAKTKHTLGAAYLKEIDPAESKESK